MRRDPSGNKYHKYGLEETCLDLYSDPNFFLKQVTLTLTPTLTLTLTLTRTLTVIPQAGEPQP